MSPRIAQAALQVTAVICVAAGVSGCTIPAEQKLVAPDGTVTNLLDGAPTAKNAAQMRDDQWATTGNADPNLLAMNADGVDKSSFGPTAGVGISYRDIARFQSVSDKDLVMRDVSLTFPTDDGQATLTFGELNTSASDVIRAANEALEFVLGDAAFANLATEQRVALIATTAEGLEAGKNALVAAADAATAVLTGGASAAAESLGGVLDDDTQGPPSPAGE